MATFKGLIDGECGTTNPLIQLSQIYTRDNTHVLQDGLVQSSIHRSSDGGNDMVNQFVQDYHRPLVAPNTFHLNSLLSSLRVDDSTVRQQDHQWSEQFLDSSAPQTPLYKPAHQSSRPWNEPHYMPTSSAFLYNPPLQYAHPPMSHVYSDVDPQTSQAAQNILSYIQETQQKNSAPTVNDPLMSGGSTAEVTVADDEKFSLLDDPMFYSRDWSEAAINSSDFYSDYKFNKTNAFLAHSNPFDEGLRRLEAHDIVNAVLFFEAAVQQQADHAQAWLCLGITQSENEQDRSAICALKKCIELDPKNLEAYISIASCYANESLTDNAMQALSQWLLNNDKYAHLSHVNRLQPMTTAETRFPDEVLFEQLQQSFLQAIALSPDNIDCDLQVCLGVLFHLLCDYEKAAECFQTAVLVKPNNPQLWNKLGAALANGGQSEKAIDAYYHALTLSPGFVRARYNLGISCFNLTAYTPAIEHFLTALKQQSDGIGPHGTQTQMSENIWRTLGTAIGHIHRSDLNQSVIYRDLPKLLKEFHIE